MAIKPFVNIFITYKWYQIERFIKVEVLAIITNFGVKNMIEYSIKPKYKLAQLYEQALEELAATSENVIGYERRNRAYVPIKVSPDLTSRFSQYEPEYNLKKEKKIGF